jgi:hypothetical protein
LSVVGMHGIQVTDHVKERVPQAETRASRQE